MRHFHPHFRPWCPRKGPTHPLGQAGNDFSALFCCRDHGLQTKKGTDAKSTVEMEVQDNLYLMVQHFMKETGGQTPKIMMDNIAIQSGIEDGKIDSRYGTIVLPRADRIRFPPYSPDINQVVEHSVGAIKTGALNGIYTHVASHTRMHPHSLQAIVKQQVQLFKKGELFKGGVLHNIQKLPSVIKAISLPEGQCFTDARGKVHYGSGGDWVKAADR